ncbi:MAG: glycosyl hydrolase family 65 protein [Pirellulales bacterium]
MQTLNELHSLHHDRAFTGTTLWDGWLPHAVLWASEKKREQYRGALLARRIDDEGYVSMQQHRGMAHNEGWPFPAWQQSSGKGFHFSLAGDEWAVVNFGMKPLRNTTAWTFEGATETGFDDRFGLILHIDADSCSITTPAIRCETIVAPFVKLEWSSEKLPESATARIQWSTTDSPEWSADRSMPIALPTNKNRSQILHIPLYRHQDYQGRIARYRIAFKGANGAEIKIKALHTAVDTRHPITGPLFVRACSEQYLWTGDVEFLKAVLPKMRRAMQYTLSEFSVDSGKHVFVPWVGHDGRSGLRFDATGKKTFANGHGVGNNYWDLLPFGAHDAMATMITADAIQWLIPIEQAVEAHPEWGLTAAPPNLSSAQWQGLLNEIRIDFQKRFWNAETKRFNGWVDVDGRAYDYGFTFVNLEAIYYGLASPEQARDIFDWIDGRREIADDTSRGSDIYHWRFAPRATTRRNVETYVWPWASPESIPFGDQVQDGGAVLGFSFHDLMARIEINGPDDAWKRLQTITAWFREVQAEGGYRKYYAGPGRGKLQGGGPPGGLGLDEEFLESVLVPQVMLYGFLGFQPGADSYRITPRLPKEWSSLTIRGVRWRNQVLDITAYADGRVEVK